MTEIERAQRYIREHYPNEMHERLLTALDSVISEEGAVDMEKASKDDTNRAWNNSPDSPA